MPAVVNIAIWLVLLVEVEAFALVVRFSRLIMLVAEVVLFLVVILFTTIPRATR